LKTTNGLILAAVIFCAGFSHAAAFGQVAEAKPAAAPKAGDRAAIQGKWEILEIHSKGEQAPAEFVDGSTLTFAGDKMTVNIKLDPKPKVIKITMDETKKHWDTTDEEKNQTNVGIYELKGDELRFCINTDEKSTERPTAAKSEKEGPNGVLFVLRRAKP
jgi:uncharacterized protein (TIGR03067 family)